MSKEDLERSLLGCPGVRKVVATAKDFRALMLAYDGTLLLFGRMWDIKSSPAGAGLRHVWLEDANPPSAPKKGPSRALATRTGGNENE